MNAISARNAVPAATVPFDVKLAKNSVIFLANPPSFFGLSNFVVISCIIFPNFPSVSFTPNLLPSAASFDTKKLSASDALVINVAVTFDVPPLAIASSTNLDVVVAIFDPKLLAPATPAFNASSA